MLLYCKSPKLSRGNISHAYRPARAWFLEIVPVRTSVCVCVSAPRLLITSGRMWRDMDPIRLVKQVLQSLYGNCSRYMETVVVIINERGLGIDTRHSH